MATHDSANSKEAPFYGGTLLLKGGDWTDTWEWAETAQSFDVHQTKIVYRDKAEYQFYDMRLAEYNENEWYSWLIDYLVGELFTDIEFEGEGADEVRKFFTKTCPNAFSEIEKMGLNVVREGTGGLKKFSVDGKLRQIRALNGRLIRLERTNKKDGTSGSPGGSAIDDYDAKWLRVTITGDKKFERHIQIWKNETPESYRDEEIALCRIKLDQRNPYGIGFGKSSFHVIQGLKSMDRDILAAIKKYGANVLIAALDLTHLDSDAQKKEACRAASADWAKLSGAESGIFAMDKENDVFYIGQGLDGRGGQSADRLLKTMEFIEPVLSAVLMNFLMAIGIVEQTGANKSLIARQEQRAERQMQRYQRAVGRFIETQLVPDITDKDCRVIYTRYYEPEIWFDLFKIGAVSKEWLQERFGIHDEGETFVYDLQAAAADITFEAQSRLKAAREARVQSGSQGDGEEKGRVEPKSKPVQKPTI